jgi:predicted N-formylglutamate amidohydrolase
MLLGPSDPAPAEMLNSDRPSRFVVVCEHAGRAIPAALGDLGIAPSEMDRHIAYDIGAEGLARRLAELLDAPLALQRYSRLVVDCNRPFAAPDCIVETSDGTRISGNCGLSAADRQARIHAIHEPFHAEIARLLDRRAEAGRNTILVAIHSFTPTLAGRARPWRLGVCSNRDPRFADAFFRAFMSANPALTVGRNEPYPIDDSCDFTIPVHGEARGLPHVLVEVRNDLLGNGQAQDKWALPIAGALEAAARSFAKETVVAA